MSTIYAQLVVAHDETSANDGRDLYAETGLVELAGSKIRSFIEKCTKGAHPCSILTRVNSVKATGTVTLSSFAAADTITISGVVFTGRASAPSTDEFIIGADDTAAAAAAAVVINANATTSAQVVATSALGVITLTALVPGALGNAVTLAISAHGSASAARMASGTNGTTETTHYFGSGS